MTRCVLGAALALALVTPCVRPNDPDKVSIPAVRVPQWVRPDEAFPVVVEVAGTVAQRTKCRVRLEVYPPGSREPVKTLEEVTQSNLPPVSEVRFRISARDLAVSKPGELPEGTWKLVARAGDAVSDPAEVEVQPGPLRVVLVTDAPGRDYYAARDFFVRESDRQRVELSTLVQTPAKDDRPAGLSVRELDHFPDGWKGDESRADERPTDLASYHLVVAFDPDWTKLTPKQPALLEKWLEKVGGGLIVVAGPVNTPKLAAQDNRRLFKPLLDLLPVVPQAEAGKDEGEPQIIRLGDSELLDKSESLEFFFGPKPEGDAPKLVRGFYSCYPTVAVKKGAEVRSTFGKDRPWLVTAAYGSGRVFWLGSGESWRMRAYKEAFHERFWSGLARQATARTLRASPRRILLVMGQRFTAKQEVNLEVQAANLEGKPLPPDARLAVRFEGPPGVADKDLPNLHELTARTEDGEPTGWFHGQFQVQTPGEYRVEVTVKETGETGRARFVVREPRP